MKKATDYDYQIIDFDEEIRKLSIKYNDFKYEEMLNKLEDKMLDSIIMKKIHPDYFEMQKKCYDYTEKFEKLEKENEAYKNILSSIFKDKSNKVILNNKANNDVFNIYWYMLHTVNPTFYVVIGDNKEEKEILDNLIKEKNIWKN